METLVLTLHIIVCVLLVILILLQAGKEGMGVIFGGGNAGVFGSGGAGGILAKMTAFMAVVFVITCLTYTYVTSPRVTAPKSAIVGVDWVAPEASAPASAPAAPEAAKPAEKADAPAITPPAAPEAAKPDAPAADAAKKAEEPKKPEEAKKDAAPAAGQ